MLNKASQFTNDYAHGSPVVFPLSESYYNFTGERFIRLIKEFLQEYRLIEKIENRGRKEGARQD